jgi:hypothetical protein
VKLENLNFVEQAELLQESDFLSQLASHPDEENIVRKLLGPGAKLLIGPRGSGKSTLMLKAYYETLRNSKSDILPVYVNFKNSLSLEPLYKKDIQASFIFKNWLAFNTILEMHSSLVSRGLKCIEEDSVEKLKNITTRLQQNNFTGIEGLINSLNLPSLEELLEKCILDYKFKRIVILMDDAAHAFSVEQQHDFFEFFRALRSRDVSPKAAIYPGVTNYPPTFHVGHDAEEIDVWIDPLDAKYTDHMLSILKKRTPPEIHPEIDSNQEKIDFLAYCSFGIPRTFLGMVFDHISTTSKKMSLDVSSNKIYKTNKKWFERNFRIFESLSTKLPRYKEFVKFGKVALGEIVSEIKEYNRVQNNSLQSVIIGLKKPIPAEFQKILQFYQYSGLVLPKDKVSRGIKGEFELYAVHYGLLADSNAVTVAKAKNISKFNFAFSHRKAHSFTRTTVDKIFSGEDISKICLISLPSCPRCHNPRINENLKFCGFCGYQLTESSIFLEIIEKDISNLALTSHRVKTIKEHSNIRFIKDILIDNEHKELRKVNQVGPYWADKIFRMAEEYIS